VDCATANGSASVEIPQNPAIQITKTPDLQKVDLGGPATFDISVTNTGNVTLTNVSVSDPLADDCVWGAIGTLAPGATFGPYSCTETVSGDFTNVATATGTPPIGDDVSASDDAVVDALPKITVTKTADPKNVLYPGADVTFTVVIANNSGPGDTVTINSLTDDVYGDLTVNDDAKVHGDLSCTLPLAIAPGSSATCSFTAFVGVTGTDVTGFERDVVTAEGTDEEGNPASDTDDEIVTITPPILVTDSALCTFDTDGDANNGRQWRRIFTQDVQQWPNFKLTATNPGQYFYNVSIFGEPGALVEVTLEIPWPFVTQGAKAIHVYDSVGLDLETRPGQTCLVPGNEAAAIDNVITLMDYELGDPRSNTGYTEPQTTVEATFWVTIPSTGFAYINQHLDDGLKGAHVDVDGDGIPERYAKHGDDDAVDPATIGDPEPTVLIPELRDHKFSLLAPALPFNSDTVQNDNEFKKNPGVAGRVTLGTTADGDSVDGVRVDLKDATGAPIGTCDGKVDKKGNPDGSACIGYDVTDLDGWWQIVYKHKGKPEEFTVTMAIPDDSGSYLSCEAPGWGAAVATLIDVEDPAIPGNVISVPATSWSRIDQLKGNEFSEVNIELNCSP
jgi:uncharacterized repeat protein (TIGR01451 family)